MIPSEQFFWFYFYYVNACVFECCPSLKKEQRDSDLLLGIYDGYEFPVIYKETNKSRIECRLKERDGEVCGRNHFLKSYYGGRNFVASDEVVDLLMKNNITGWKTYPVEVYSKEGKMVKGYNGFSITGRCGAVKPSLCEEVNIGSGKHNDPRVEGYWGDPLDLDTWDGSDIFILEHTVYKYASQKAKKVLELLEEDCLWFVDIAKRPIIKKDAIWKAPMGVVINE